MNNIPATYACQKKTRSSFHNRFDWLSECLYCGGECDVSRDPNYPKRWKLAYLVRQTEEQKNKCIGGKPRTMKCMIKANSQERADKWAWQTTPRRHKERMLKFIFWNIITNTCRRNEMWPLSAMGFSEADGTVLATSWGAIKAI